MLDRFDTEMRRYFGHESLIDKSIPTVGYFADRLNVSPNYLSDLLRKLTGKSTIEHIHFHVVEKAKDLLVSSDKTVAEIAYELGFEYPPYFTRFFKKKTQTTPLQFRTRTKLGSGTIIQP